MVRSTQGKHVAKFSTANLKGAHPVFFVVKLDFEIAVEQQTRAHDQTFEMVPDSGCPLVPWDSHALIWSNYGSIFPNHLNMLETVLCGAQLIATSHLKTYTKFYRNRIKIGRVMSKILYAHIWTYATNVIDFGP